MPARPGSGRKVIPINIKEAKGTRRHHREKIVVPPSDKIAVPPSALNKRAKQIFQHYVKRRLEPLGLASATYTEEIARLAVAHEEWERYTRLVNDIGYVASVNGVEVLTSIELREDVKVKDIAKARDTANAVMKACLLEFGLTAASAQKVGKPQEKKDKSSGKERFFD